MRWWRAWPAQAVDLGGQALGGVLGRPGRACLTLLGTAGGIATLVAVLGLTSTVSAQVSDRFDILEATEVTVSALDDGEAPDTGEPGGAELIVPGVEERVRGLNGVEQVGLDMRLDTSSLPVRGSWATSSPSGAGDTPVEVRAVSPAAFDVMGAHVERGRLFDEFHARRAERVAVLGRVAANALAVDDVVGQPAIFIGDVSYTVVGIVDDVDRHDDMLLSVMIPAETAVAEWGPEVVGDRRILIETRPGAAQLVGAQAPFAVAPQAPRSLVSAVPPTVDELRRTVEGDVNRLFVVLAGVSLLIGAFGIANTALVAVLERVPEIGLRRALGATRAHVCAQFLLESSLLGTLGGAVGTCLGLLVVLAVAAARTWAPVIEPAALFPAPLIGTVVGLVAGLYPALKASGIEPTEALRR